MASAIALLGLAWGAEIAIPSRVIDDDSAIGRVNGAAAQQSADDRQHS
jgi:hypothetical protein